MQKNGVSHLSFPYETNYSFLQYVYQWFASTHLSVPYMCSAPQRWEEAIGVPELELQIFMGPKNQIWTLCSNTIALKH